MAGTHSSLAFVVFLVRVAFVICNENDSTATVLRPLSSLDIKPSGALASFLKMLVDVPLAVIEAFRDGAEGIEKIVLGTLRTFF